MNNEANGVLTTEDGRRFLVETWSSARGRRFEGDEEQPATLIVSVIPFKEDTP